MGHPQSLLSGDLVHPPDYISLTEEGLNGHLANAMLIFLWGVRMARRAFLRQLVALPFAGAASSLGQGTPHKTLNIMMKSAWGSDDPTKAAFPFLHGLALSEAGHSVQIFLLGEAVSLMRKSLAGAVVPVGWPPLEQTLTKVAERHVQIYACGACSRARAVLQTDLDQWGAKFGNPTIFVSLVEWADRIITE
jgi:predicted peroxiredoxin